MNSMLSDAQLIILNSGTPEKLEQWMNKNDVHGYGFTKGYAWVSWSGKLGNAVYTNEQLFDLYKKDNP